LIAVDSAATHDFQVGRPPHPRAIAAAGRRGLDLSPLRARQIVGDDFHRFHHVLAMDLGNLRDLEALCPAEERRRLALFLDWAPEAGVREVADPYLRGPEAFETMLDLIEIGARGLLARLAA
jgi:protein-tyrosine phosphatase